MSATHVEFDGGSFPIPTDFDVEWRRLLLNAAKVIEDAMDEGDYTEEEIEIPLEVIPNEVLDLLVAIVQKSDPSAKASYCESDEHDKEDSILFLIRAKPEVKKK